MVTAVRIPATPSPLEDRRQRAREAYYDGTEPGDVVTIQALDGAIETATRVRITDEAVAEFGQAWHNAPQDGPPGTRRRAALIAALRELGFEVEQ